MLVHFLSLTFIYSYSRGGPSKQSLDPFDKENLSNSARALSALYVA